MRLIDADALLKELEEWEADLYDTTPERQLGVTDAIVIACQMPTVDAVPVEWIEEWILSTNAEYKRIAVGNMLNHWKAERKEE